MHTLGCFSSPPNLPALAGSGSVPGQGTQAWGMGKELYNTYLVAKAVFDEADKLLGFSFSKKLFETDSTEIMDTEIT